jgi:hypothetical protein
MVPKPDGSWRPCGDYSRLNTVTTPDKYPLPNLQDLSSHLHGATIFSKLDLEKGYYQVPMNPADVPKTAIINPFGLFEFKYLHALWIKKRRPNVPAPNGFPLP